MTRKRKEEGATLIEYAILILAIVLVCIVSIKMIGGDLIGKFSMIASGVQNS